MPFGVISAPATFQSFMERVLHGLYWKTLLLYLDDIIVFAPDCDTPLHRLERVFQQLKGAKLTPNKCELFQSQVYYLGHEVIAEGVATDAGKTRAVQEWQTLQRLKGLQGFLGMVGYYL